MKVHNYAEYTLYGWCFSRNFPKIFGTAILKENLLKNVPFFIEEHLWMSVFNEATFKKKLLDVNPPQSWSGKENDTTVVTAVMILEVVNNWKSVLQINILKKKVRLWSLSPSVTGNTCCHYNIWVTGVYMAYIFDRNSRGKEFQIEWFESNLWSFVYFECSPVLWLLLDPSCKGTLLQELAGHLRPRLLPDTQNRAFPKNGSYIHILDTTLVLWILSAILLAIKSSVAPAFYKLIFSNSFKCICSSLFSVINFLTTFTIYIFTYFLRQKLTPYV